MATGKAVGVGEGLGFEASPAPATREMTDGPEEDDKVLLLGLATGVKSGTPEDVVEDGSPPERMLLGVPPELLGESVAVVVVL